MTRGASAGWYGFEEASSGRGDAEPPGRDAAHPRDPSSSTVLRGLPEGQAPGALEQVVVGLSDDVVRRLFNVGVKLAGAHGLAESPEARAQISEAIDELDVAIGAVRGLVFDLSCHRTPSGRWAPPSRPTC